MGAQPMNRSTERGLPEETCPACVGHRRHTAEDWKAYHPNKGHGYQHGQGWSRKGLGKPDAGTNTSNV